MVYIESSLPPHERPSYPLSHPGTTMADAIAEFPSAVRQDEHGNLLPIHTQDPSVTLLDRIDNLEDSLGALAQASKLGGLAIAGNGYMAPGARGRLEERYDDVDKMVGASSDKRRKKLSEAEDSFYQAYGLDDLIKASPKDEEKIRKEAYASYREFVGKFADAKGSAARDKLRRDLKKQKKNIIKSQEA